MAAVDFIFTELQNCPQPSEAGVPRNARSQSTAVIGFTEITQNSASALHIFSRIVSISCGLATRPHGDDEKPTLTLVSTG